MWEIWESTSDISQHLEKQLGVLERGHSKKFLTGKWYVHLKFEGLAGVTGAVMNTAHVEMWKMGRSLQLIKDCCSQSTL